MILEFNGRLVVRRSWMSVCCLFAHSELTSVAAIQKVLPERARQVAGSNATPPEA
jgi:hypothetical protein